MSIFQDPRDEEKLCQVLKAYVEEWGPENVVVSVPRHWEEYSTGNLGRVKLEFTTDCTVSIRVEYEFVRLTYDVQLQTA
jgi:RNase H-fold protein (predicted Holliday junction resolvase)